jgi:hypothetical protein
MADSSTLLQIWSYDGRALFFLLSLNLLLHGNFLSFWEGFSYEGAGFEGFHLRRGCGCWYELVIYL